MDPPQPHHLSHDAQLVGGDYRHQHPHEHTDHDKHKFHIAGFVDDQGSHPHYHRPPNHSRGQFDHHQHDQQPA